MVVVGVTGHRVLAEIDKIENGLEEVVGTLETAFPDEWTVVSGLAEGADRLITERLLLRGRCRLIAILALHPDEYATDFDAPESRGEFWELLRQADEVVEVAGVSNRDAAYEAAGREMLRRAEVLVAIWDGDDGQGRGGTGQIVAEARARDLPVAWIHAGNRVPGTREPRSLGRQQGSVTYERLSGSER